MASDLHVHRLFQPGPGDTGDLLRGLDLAGFHQFRPGLRGADGAFRGPAAQKINASEAFFQDAVSAIRHRAIVIPSPFGGGDIATTDALVSPATPWATVPLYCYRFSQSEPFFLLKRGLSWCTDLGLYFPERHLLISFQTDDTRVAQDCADLAHAFAFFADHADVLNAREPTGSSASTPCVIVNSGHFAHHIWNELSVIEGLVAEGLHGDVRILANHSPLGDLAALFPEIPSQLVLNINGSSEELLLYAMARSWLVAPAGRRHIPQRLVTRILAHAEATYPASAAAAATFRAQHDLILWVTLRVDARTATNLTDVVATTLATLLSQHPSTGVVFDGFTLADGDILGDWSRGLIKREQRALNEILARVGTPFDYRALSGRFTMEAFLWARAADYYICPYGTAQHKVAWFTSVPGVIHAGENKRAVESQDPATYARQDGRTPRFFYGNVTRADTIGNDFRSDLFSYELDRDAFAACVAADVESLLAARPTTLG